MFQLGSPFLSLQYYLEQAKNKQRSWRLYKTSYEPFIYL